MTTTGSRIGVELQEVLAAERPYIEQKREKYHPEDKGGPSFGIALSGGGVRSATVNLGVLKVLNAGGLLSRADYISTVSGGGYIGGFVHAKLQQGGGFDAFKKLFPKEEIDALRGFGYYLTPGTGLEKVRSYLRMTGALVASLLLNWIWVIALGFVLVFLPPGLYEVVGPQPWSLLGTLYVGAAGIILCSWYFLKKPEKPGPGIGGLSAAFALVFLVKWLYGLDCLEWCRVFLVYLAAAGLVLGYHYFGHGLRHVKLWNSDILNGLEGLLVGAGVLAGGLYAAGPPLPEAGRALLVSLGVLLVTGFFANPNIITLHRFYRDRLAGAYLRTAGTGDKGLKLAELRPGADGGYAPYPLINTCLNLFSQSDPDFKGTKGSDYFLLSPLYCGSKLTGYADTRSPGYRNMTLATAVAVSGAAVSPHMGTQSNRILAFLMTLLNLRTGYWAVNPRKDIPWVCRHITWWPYYNILELLSRKGTVSWRVNLADGGFIENLGVYELLRRRCRLILAVDATADPGYTFGSLNNLVIRARNELGVAITFRQDPETFIRPLRSRGFSRSHFVMADLTDLPGKKPEDRLYETPGLLIYLKSSLRPRNRVREITGGQDSYFYKTYHAAFPQESTGDQFFDPDQWEAYYDLGRFMAGDLLGVKLSEEGGAVEAGGFDSLQAVWERFAPLTDAAALEELLKAWDARMQEE